MSWGPVTHNRGVCRAWLHGRPARNSKNTLKTDGINLWSYDLMIGSGSIVLDYTAPDNFESATTSRHVGLAKIYAGFIAIPKEKA